MTDQKQIAKWHEAHPDLRVPDAGLETMAPFASLYAVDFLTYLETKGQDPAIAQFLRSMLREIVWTYDAWTKLQRDANPAVLLDDMINNCNAGGGEGAAFYAPIRKFLIDYAHANGFVLRTDQQAPNWMTALEEPSVRSTDIRERQVGVVDAGQRSSMNADVYQTGVTAPPPLDVVFGADGTPVDNVLTYKPNGSAAPGL